jgi:hypothetical protein
VFKFKFYVLLFIFFFSFQSLEAKSFRQRGPIEVGVAIMTVLVLLSPVQASNLAENCVDGRSLITIWDEELRTNYGITFDELSEASVYRGTLNVYTGELMGVSFYTLPVPTLIRLFVEVCNDWKNNFNSREEAWVFLRRIENALVKKNLWRLE